MTDKEIIERAKEAEKRIGFGELVHSPISKGVNSAYGIGFIEGMVEYRNSLQEEPVSEQNLSNVQRIVKNWKELVSEELEEAMQHNAPNNIGIDDLFYWRNGFMAGAKWQKEKEYTCYEEAFEDGAAWKVENLWKPADGDDLPEIDREVIVLIKYNAQRNVHDKEYSTYRVGFGHRPNPDGWDGKNIDTNEVTHYTPKLYDKGGWNAPNIVYWLDAELPKEIEL